MTESKFKTAEHAAAETAAAQMRKTARFARVFVADNCLVVELDRNEI